MLMKIFGPVAYGIVFGLVGGMMTFISVHELLPTAFRYDPANKVTSSNRPEIYTYIKLIDFLTIL